MNMHGFIAPPTETTRVATRTRLASTLDWLRSRRSFLFVVVIPTLLVAGYYYLIAANQYQSEAHFVIRSAQDTGPAVSGFGQMLGLAGGSTSSESEARGVSDYLQSHEVVQTLALKLGLVDRFQRPEADFLSRLRPENPTPEKLLAFYRSKVKVELNRDTSISEMRVRTFRPQDSYDIINALLVLGENRVNELNERTYRDSVSSARAQLADAERAAAIIQSRITSFRQNRGDIDPAGTGEAQIQMVAAMTASLSAARAQLAAMGALISPSSPQYLALQQRVRSLERELAGQSGRLTGTGSTIAGNLGGYEDLKVRQDFVAKRYEAAAANLEKAREQVGRQQLYLVRIVEPNRPVKSQFPQRHRTVLTVMIGLMIAYMIGWLLVAGVREHAL